MTKQFYDCPIKAAYMAKEFGVRYKSVTGFGLQDITQWELADVNGDLRGTLRRLQGEYHIHPDSYSIFEPKEGDLLQDRKGECLTYTIPQNLDMRYFKIIQRDNKSFIMPEREE